MDFFASQDRARRHTLQMVLLFAFAVALVVFAVNAVAAAAWIVFADQVPMLVPGVGVAAAVPVPGKVYLWASILTLAIIASGSLYRVIQLAQGGVAVATMVGARRVARDSVDPAERRLLNVVEEMALASGLAVPQVYVMEKEASINAFAAGYSPNEAVVTVTRGTLDQLNRDELQGVVAHEFSHILNGDMRLSIRLIGLLEGITLIGAIGAFLMRQTGRVRSSRDNSGSLGLALLAFGVALAVIGCVGVFCARVIKAAISRQREFLADASAVQFTRNPEGIGGALYRIGQQGALIDNRHAEAMSHLYFGAAIRSSMAGLLATHPPISERIERVLGSRALLYQRNQARRRDEQAASLTPAGVSQPGPDAGTDAAASGESDMSGAAIPVTAAGVMGASPSPSPPATPGIGWGRADAALTTSSQAVLDSVGNPGIGQVDYARQFLAGLPDELRSGVGAEAGAGAALCALLLRAGSARAAQLAMIEKAMGRDTAAQAEKFAAVLARIGARARMPVLELALPTLRSVPQPARDALLLLLRQLAEEDRRVSVAELVVLTLCTRHLGGDTQRAPPVKHKSYATVIEEVIILLSLLTRVGKGGERVFAKAMASIPVAGALRPAAELSIAAVESALYELKLLAPLKKPLLIKACLQVVMADGVIEVAEAELLRAVCAALDCPLPPIIDQRPV